MTFSPCHPGVAPEPAGIQCRRRRQGRRGFLALLDLALWSAGAREGQNCRAIHGLATLSSGGSENAEATSSSLITSERAIALERTLFVLNGS
jgi:hypothetical protein